MYMNDIMYVRSNTCFCLLYTFMKLGALTIGTRQCKFDGVL